MGVGVQSAPKLSVASVYVNQKISTQVNFMGKHEFRMEKSIYGMKAMINTNTETSFATVCYKIIT